MIHDLCAIAVAFLLWPMLAVAPGYVATLVFDPLGVSRRSWALRLALAVALSFCVAPIALHWLWRFGGVGVAWAFVAACGLATIAHAARSHRGVVAAVRNHRFELLCCVAWVALIVFVQLPLQVGDRLFLSFPWTDYSKHVAMTAAISRTGVPPVNPYYAPGHAMPTYYYYGWFLMSSLIEQVGRGRFWPGQVIVAGAAWTGIALWASLLLLDRQLFPARDGVEARRRRRWTFALICVTGLDALIVLPKLLIVLLPARPGVTRVPFRSAENWNEQVTGWLDVAFWVPQHVAGIVATILGLIVIRGAFAGRARDDDRAAPEPWLAIGTWPWRAILLAGVTFASCLFVSIYLGMAAVVAAATWGLWCLARRRRAEFASLVVAGGLAGVLCVPYLLELKKAQLVHAPPLAISVRAFGPVAGFFVDKTDPLYLSNRTYIYPGEAKPTVWPAEFAYLAALPLNYALEFGFYAFAVWAYFYRLRRRGAALSDDERFGLALAGSLLLLCTFVKSALVFNDLGWRSMHPAQAVLLAVGVSVMLRRHELSRRARGVAWALLWIGVLSTATNVALLRGAALWDAARGISRDRSRDALALRDAYDWMAANAPRDAVVLYDPIEPYGSIHGDFGRRQVAIADPVYGTVLGIPKELYVPWKDRLGDLFADQRFTPENTAVLRELKATHLLVMNTDALWAARDQVAGATLHANDRVVVLDVAALLR